MPSPDQPTFSGDVITDATRAAAIQGDGLAPEQRSTGIWEATTNLVTNGGFETNTTGWSLAWAATLSRVTSEAKFGTASLRIVTDGVTTNGEGAQNVADAIALTAGNTYTFSCWVKGPVNGRVAETIVWRSSGAYNGDVSSGIVTLTGAWQRITLTATAPALTDACQLYVQLPYLDPSGVQAITFYVDGIQLEQQPLATPYVETNGGTADRIQGRALAPSTTFDETQGWVAIRVAINWPSSSIPTTSPEFFSWGSSALVKVRGPYVSAGSWKMSRYNGAATGDTSVAASFTTGSILTVIGTWTSTQVGISVNGSPFTLAGNTNIPVIISDTVDIGNSVNDLPNRCIDSDVFWFAAGSGLLVDANALTIAGFNNDPKIADFPGTPTWFWDSGPDGISIPLPRAMIVR